MKTADEMFKELGYEIIYFKKPVVGSRWKKVESGTEYTIQVFPDNSCNKFINVYGAGSMDSFEPQEILACAQLIKEMEEEQ